MQLQHIIDYCSAKPGAVKEFPFDDTTLVVKVGTALLSSPEGAFDGRLVEAIVKDLVRTNEISPRL